MTIFLCNHCGHSGANYKRCSQCKTVHYCSDTCHKQSWPEHKVICLLLARPQNQDLLSITILNPRDDRKISSHGNNTTEIKILRQDVIAFIEQLDCDPNEAALMSMDENLPIGAHGNCFANVNHLVELHGGKSRCGWQLFENRYLIEAEAHCVWQSPDDPKPYINITPCNAGAAYTKQICKTLFVPCKKVKYVVSKHVDAMIRNVILWK